MSTITYGLSPGTASGGPYQGLAVPEPSTVIAGALLLPFGASTLRILRRNRMA